MLLWVVRLQMVLSSFYFSIFQTFYNEYELLLKIFKKIPKYNIFEKAPSNQLTLVLFVWSCYVKNPKKKINKLRYEPLRQRHIVQEHAAHKQTLHDVLETPDRALAKEHGAVTGRQQRSETLRRADNLASQVSRVPRASPARIK